jgi:hypothetical protein
MNGEGGHDGIGDLLSRAYAEGSDEARAGGRAAAIRAFNRIEVRWRAERGRRRSRSRARRALLGLGWLAAAAWVVRALLWLGADEAPVLVPQAAVEGLGTLAALVAVTPTRLVAGLLLLAAVTVAMVRLSLVDD